MWSLVNYTVASHAADKNCSSMMVCSPNQQIPHLFCCSDLTDPDQQASQNRHKNVTEKSLKGQLFS